MSKRLKELLHLNPVDGDIGIEIEMEASSQFPPSSPIGWLPHSDGSLKGYAREYVSAVPITIDKVDSELEKLKVFLSGMDIHHSFRAGVHIHVNCQNLTLQQIGTFAAVYWALEPSLVKFCGSNREGNLFCLRLCDAEAPFFLLLETLKSGQLGHVATDNIRYASLNLRALATHGSLEFRAMETLPDLSKIAEWSRMLYHMREYVISIPDRTQIAYDISFNGPGMWAEKVLGEEGYNLIKYEGMDKDIITSMRGIQELIYFNK